MPNYEAMISVLLAGFLISISPGPSMLYVLSRSVGQSCSAGIASSVGLAIGGIVLAVLSALGLAMMISVSPTLYTSIQVLGAGYLFYLGWCLIRESQAEDMSIKKIGRESYRRIVLQGMWVEVLNPKTALFFLAFIPQFVDSSRNDITTQLLWLGILVPLTAIPSDVLVALGGSSLAAKIGTNPRLNRLLALLSAFVLIGLGARLLLV